MNRTYFLVEPWEADERDWFWYTLRCAHRSGCLVLASARRRYTALRLLELADDWQKTTACSCDNAPALQRLREYAVALRKPACPASAP